MVDVIKSGLSKIYETLSDSIPLSVKLKEHYIQNGRKWSEANIIGVRFAKDFYTNKFLDVLAIATNDGVLSLRATTVPGPYWTPENCKKFGVSYPTIMCLGFHEDTFGFANHRDHPPGQALRARAKLPCFRDTDRDSKMSVSEGPYFEPSNSGMDIHAQSLNDSDELVGFASAGCQVAQSRALFLSRFMPMLYATKEAKNGQAARFSYLLVDDSFPFAAKLKSLAQ